MSSIGSALGGLLGGSAGASSAPSPNVWQPAQVGAQNKNLLDLLNKNYSNVGQNNPYSTYTPNFLSVFDSLYNNPAASGFQSAAGASGAASAGVGNQNIGASSALNTSALDLLPGASSVMNLGLDPQAGLYKQLLQKTNDQANVHNAQYGLTGQQAVGNVDQATTNFNIDWQNNMLDRALKSLAGGTSAVTGATQAATGAGNLGTAGAAGLLTGGATPYQASTSIGGNKGAALTQLMQELLGPTTSSQSTISNLLSYLGLGAQQSNAQAGQLLNNYQAMLTGAAGGAAGGSDIGGHIGSFAADFAPMFLAML